MKGDFNQGCFSPTCEEKTNQHYNRRNRKYYCAECASTLNKKYRTAEGHSLALCVYTTSPHESVQLTDVYSLNKDCYNEFDLIEKETSPSLGMFEVTAFRTDKGSKIFSLTCIMSLHISRGVGDVFECSEEYILAFCDKIEINILRKAQSAHLMQIGMNHYENKF